LTGGGLIRRLSLLVLVVVSSPAALPGQRPVVTLPPLVRAVEVNRLNIFADSEATFFLPRLANRFHFRTRPDVVERELLFRAGEPYDSAAVSETARNLRRLGIFRLVRVDSAMSDTGLIVRVTTQDGWSTKPEFAFRSTGGQVAWRVSLVEENFLGTASSLVLGYTKDPDRSAFVVGFRQPRIIARSIGVAFQLDDRSDGTLLYAAVQRPFLSLSDRHGWAVSFDRRDERVLRYFEGETLPSDTLQRDFGAAAASVGVALSSGPKEYHRVAVGGRVWQDRFTRQDSVFGALSAVGSLGASWEFRHARYLLVRGFTTTREEDVDLSSTVRIGASVTPRLFGWEEHGITPSLSARVGGVVTDRAFGYVDFNAHGRFTTAGLDSGAVQLGATVLYSPIARHSLVVHGWAGVLDNPRPGGEFDLGLGVGPRGFRLHAFTGDRAVYATAEYRYLFALDVLKTFDLGFAGFTDYGGAWYAGAPKRTGWDFGGGLRLGYSRSTDLEMTRIDLVRRVASPTDPAGWLIVIGRGLTFSTAGVLNR
jgi:hypothetical protein